jgi:hypothetical protein
MPSDLRAGSEKPLSSTVLGRNGTMARPLQTLIGESWSLVTVGWVCYRSWATAASNSLPTGLSGAFGRFRTLQCLSIVHAGIADIPETIFPDAYAGSLAGGGCGSNRTASDAANSGSSTLPITVFGTCNEIHIQQLRCFDSP